MRLGRSVASRLSAGGGPTGQVRGPSDLEVTMDTPHCVRCLRPAPKDVDWAALTLGPLLVCPDCVTPEEQKAMDEAHPRDASGRYRRRVAKRKAR